MPIGAFPFLFYLYQYLKIKKSIDMVLCLFAFFLLMLALVLMSGRTRIVMYLVCAALLIFYVKSGGVVKISTMLRSLSVAFLVLIVVVAGKPFFGYLAKSDSGISFGEYYSDSGRGVAVSRSLFGYFTHRVYSAEVALSTAAIEDGLGVFKDSILFPLYFIPERLTGVRKPDSISFVNTENLTNVYDSMVPPGLVAYGIYSLWLPGVLIVAFIYGYVYGYIDRMIKVKGDYDVPPYLSSTKLWSPIPP